MSRFGLMVMDSRKIGKNWLMKRAVHERKKFGSHVASVNTIESSERRWDRFIDEDDRWCYVYGSCLV